MIIGILQARCSSTRLPGKVLRPVLGRPMVLRQCERIGRATTLDRLIVATSEDPSDDPLVDAVRAAGIDVRRGPLDDVAARFASVIDEVGPDHFVRLTADCPLTDPAVIDLVVAEHLRGGADYTSNTLVRTFPDGLDVECVRADAFARLLELDLTREEREHVTAGLYRRPERFSLRNVARKPALGSLRWTVDVAADLEFVRDVYAELYADDPAFGQTEILALLRRRPELSRTDADLDDAARTTMEGLPR